MRNGKRWYVAVLFLAVVPSGLPAQAADMLVLTRGSDTIAVERLRRTATALQGELVDRLQKIRWSYAATLSSDSVVKLEYAVRRADQDPTGPALQEATLVFVADSVLIEIRSGGTTREQRLGTTRGAVPFVNPSFGQMELLVRRLQGSGRDSLAVPLFMVSGGQTFEAVIRRLSRDSVAIFAGAEARLAVDTAGRILGGTVPTQQLTLTRSRADDAALHVPKPDYSARADAPYSAEEVTIPTPMGHSLAGTLTLPRRATDDQRPSTRFPAVITITGSGAQDRDEEVPVVRGYRPFRQVADTLGRVGIAVLRMDDRGFGGSGGNPLTATSADFARDIEAGIAWLRARPEIDPGRIAVLGHSEGGLIGPMIASRDSALRALVILAGPSYTGRRILEYQNRYAIERTPTIRPEARDSAFEVAMRMLDSTAVTSEWVRLFLTYDPTTVAAKVRAPTLILHGATDRQVTMEQAQELAAAIRRGGNRDVTVRVFPDANHLFLQDPDGNPAGYAALPSSRVRSDVLEVLVEWLVRQLQ
jgi:uncharacterized protein